MNGRLLITCPDRHGIVAAVAGFLAASGANIVSSDQHSTDPEGGECDEGHLDERCQRHPVGVRCDGECRVRGDRAADLGEDPDQIDREPAPVCEVARDVDVIEGIRIRRVRKVPDEHDPDDDESAIDAQPLPLTA